MASTSTSQARQTLATPAQPGTLSNAYRRSIYALQNVFSNNPNSNSNQAEREPLLNGNGEGSSSAPYGSVLDLPPEMRVPKPKKVISQVRVEAKVWFANERTWISWLRVSLLLGSFSLALFNSASFFNHHHQPSFPGDEPGPEIPNGNGPNASTIKFFGAIFAGISVLTLAWGLGNYQRRVSLIKRKYGGDFDDLIGPPLICAALFIGVLLNFIVRVKQHNLETSEPLW